MDRALKRPPRYDNEHFQARISIQQNRPILVSTHWHEELEFIRVLQGPVFIQLDEYQYEAATGDILFIENNRTHFVRCIGKSNKAIMGLVFDKQLFEEYIMEFRLLQTYRSPTVNPLYYFPKDHPLNSLFTNCMDQLYQEYTEAAPFYQMAVKGTLYHMMSRLLRHYIGSLHESSRISGKAAKLTRLQPVLSYIQSHYMYEITLNDLASIATMSPYYFSRFFKSAMECTPIDYILHYRIQMSVRLLVNSDHSISQIAEEVGFSSCNYFDRSFKNFYQLSPSDYRKSMKDVTGVRSV